MFESSSKRVHARVLRCCLLSSFFCLLLMLGCATFSHHSLTVYAQETSAEKYFTDATAAWGLGDLDGVLDVRGQRLGVVDVDRSGWAGLVVRRSRSLGTVEDFDAQGADRNVWLLKNSSSDKPGGHRVFSDSTKESGLFARRNSPSNLGRSSELVVFADVNKDGAVDAYMGASIAAPLTSQPGMVFDSELMLNDGTGYFRFASEDLPLRRAGLSDRPFAATFVDVNRDGWVDLFVPQYHDGFGDENAANTNAQSRLYLNQTDHLSEVAFRDVTHVVGLDTVPWGAENVAAVNAAQAHPRAWSAGSCDLLGDGSPALMVTGYGRSPNLLWQATTSKEGALVYENVSLASTFAYDTGQDWTTNEFARCFCEKNRSAPGCAGVQPSRLSCKTDNWRHSSDREPYRLGGNTATALCADLNGDGRLDLLTTEIKHWWAGNNSDGTQILLNKSIDGKILLERQDPVVSGIAREHNVTRWDEGDLTAVAFDFDNDGWNDLLINSTDYDGTRAALFRQDLPGHFAAVALDQGIDHSRAAGVAVADFSHRGVLDVVLGHSLFRCTADDLLTPCSATDRIRVFENQVGLKNHFIQIEVEGGAGSNGSAIGARVSVEALYDSALPEGADVMTRPAPLQIQQVTGAYGHFGIQNDFVLHFGLAQATRARVTVRWPDRNLTTKTYELQAGHRYRVNSLENTEALVVF